MTKKNFLSSTLKTRCVLLRALLVLATCQRAFDSQEHRIRIYLFSLFIYYSYIHSFIYSVFLFYNLPSPNSLRDEDPKCPVFLVYPFSMFSPPQKISSHRKHDAATRQRGLGSLRERESATSERGALEREANGARFISFRFFSRRANCARV